MHLAIASDTGTGMNARVPNASAEAPPGNARPAGMSLGQWLNSRVAQPAPVQPQYPQTPTPTAAAAAHSLSEIHQRLDGITRQIDQMSQRRAAATTSGLANQLNDAIARLDSRLTNLSQPQPAAPMPQHDANGGAAYHASPPLSPAGLDAAIAEITARRHSLNDSGAYAAAPNPFMQQTPSMASAPPLAPAPPSAPASIDLSGIERQLHNLTSQMEALRRPDHLDQSIAAFREELAEIRRSLTEALPRQAIDSLESEVRALGLKLERSRESGGDQETLGGIERALNEIYGAVRSLTPAEQLTGYDTAIQNLSGKIDLLVRASPDSNIVQQLEDAIGALRNIAANVASNDAVAHLGEHIRALGEKLDHQAQSGGNDMLAALERRIAVLTTAMEGRSAAPAAVADFTHIEHAILALSERIDRLSVGTDSSGAMAHIEQRIAYVLERLEGAQASSFGNFGRIEQGLSEVMRQLEHQRASFVPDGASQPQDTSGLVDVFKRELSDVRHTQSETDRRTQDTLEALHSTLSHAVDRLATIEGDLRRMPVTPEPAAMPRAAPFPPPAFTAPMAYTPPPAIQPELPNPVVPQMSDVRLPISAPPELALRDAQAQPAPIWQPQAQRTPIDPNLPPDTPLEPARHRSR
jgi:localization factor PodJL